MPPTRLSQKTTLRVKKKKEGKKNLEKEKNNSSCSIHAVMLF